MQPAEYRKDLAFSSSSKSKVKAVTLLGAMGVHLEPILQGM